MMRTMGLAALVAVLLTGTGGDRPSERTTTVDLLTRYLSGDFDLVVSELKASASFDGTLDALRRDGPAWIDAAGPAARDRRELAAATFALEAARLGEDRAWRVIEARPGIPHVRWLAPPLLIEWGCERMRQRPAHSEAERLWFLASIAVAERSEDPEFLLGLDGRLAGDIIQHIRHAEGRFPAEVRFGLATGVSEEWRNPRAAERAFERIRQDVDAGPEATVRLGVLAWRRGDHSRALSLLDRIGERTHDPWLVYLGRYFAGQSARARRDTEGAERLYRGALAAIPGAESASVALAALLASTGRGPEASAVTEAMLGATPPPIDPWREYAHGDDRFWPFLLAALRREVHP